MSWSRAFDEPIQPAKGKKLVTLKDAAAYIMKLPKSKQESPEWQAAVETLLLVAELNGAHHDGTHRHHESIEPGLRFGSLIHHAKTRIGASAS